ncbi:hypothetical protein MMYC01_205977 [Madurella mycetomatis]|uniref:Uncharacterized protein n=1 Tax=Madurella mycetomatis TaxID=100816 RepID=A0A175W317_9PEZI|nr:hypothetical protein MMYC01_205977 [Madurella mycetomatis]
MKAVSAILLAGLASANPLRQESRQTVGPYEISGFTASKAHLSAFCRYNFNVSAPALSAPAQCSAYVDSGSSGATWLAYVYEGAGNCDNDAVTWTFFHPTSGGAATFNVTIDGARGTYTVPASDITVSLNDEENPFDNDVAYTGPREFEITNIVSV